MQQLRQLVTVVRSTHMIETRGVVATAAAHATVIIFIFIFIGTAAIVVRGGEGHQPARAVQVPVQAHEILRGAVARPEAARHALPRDEARRRHAPHSGGAVGAAHPFLELHLLPDQAIPRPRLHEFPKYPSVYPDIVRPHLPRRRRVLARIAHVQYVSAAALRQETPTRRLREPGRLDEVTRRRPTQPEIPGRLTTAAVIEKLGQSRPAADDGAVGGALGERRHHPRRAEEAELPPEEALGDCAEPPVDRGGAAERADVPFHALENQKKNSLVENSHGVGRLSESVSVSGAHSMSPTGISGEENGFITGGDTWRAKSAGIKKERTTKHVLGGHWTEKTRFGV